MKTKYIVICGPALVEHDSRINNLIVTAETEMCDLYKQYIHLDILPERFVGAQGVRNKVYDCVKNDTLSIFVTRYEHAVSQFAELVARGVIDRDELLVQLVRYDDNNIANVTEHQMTDDGQLLGDDWPFGILW